MRCALAGFNNSGRWRKAGRRPVGRLQRGRGLRGLEVGEEFAVICKASERASTANSSQREQNSDHGMSPEKAVVHLSLKASLFKVNSDGVGEEAGRDCVCLFRLGVVNCHCR